LKFLLDENSAPLHARTPRDLGCGVVSVVQPDLSGADDEVVRATAIEGGRILITLDGDFANVLRFPPTATPGVLRLRLHPATERSIDSALRRGLLFVLRR